MSGGGGGRTNPPFMPCPFLPSFLVLLTQTQSCGAADPLWLFPHQVFFARPPLAAVGLPGRTVASSVIDSLPVSSSQ